MFAQQHVQFVQYLLIFRIRFDLPNTEDTIRERPGKRQGVGNLNSKTEINIFHSGEGSLSSSGSKSYLHIHLIVDGELLALLDHLQGEDGRDEAIARMLHVRPTAVWHKAVVQLVCEGGSVVVGRVVLGRQVHVVGLAHPGEGEGQLLLLPLSHDGICPILPRGFLLCCHPDPVVERDNAVSGDVGVGEQALSPSLDGTVLHPHLVEIQISKT